METNDSTEAGPSTEVSPSQGTEASARPETSERAEASEPVGTNERLRDQLSQTGRFLRDPVRELGNERLKISPYTKSQVGKFYFDRRQTPDGQGHECWLDKSGRDGNGIDGHYLHWTPDGTETLKLGEDANLFVTAPLTGCGIIVLEKENGETLVVHHNVYEVDPATRSMWQRVFESSTRYDERNNLHKAGNRRAAVYECLENLKKEHPDIRQGAILDVGHYGDHAAVFGVRQAAGRWKMFVNHQVGTNYFTSTLHK